jgi:hypothetical protein
MTLKCGFGGWSQEEAFIWVFHSKGTSWIVGPVARTAASGWDNVMRRIPHMVIVWHLYVLVRNGSRNRLDVVHR